MMDRLEGWARTAVWALPAYGVLLAVSTITQQPDYRTDFPAYAEYVTTTTFLASHLVASIAGAALGMIGAAALFVLTEHASPGRAKTGFALWAFGQAGLLSIFGVAAFVQPAIGDAFLDGDGAAAEALNTAVYEGPLVVAASVSLLLFVAGGILLGMATRSVRTWPRWIGTAFAVSTTVFAVGVFIEIPFLQPAAGIGVAAAAAAAALSARGTPQGRTVTIADGMQVGSTR